MSLQMQVIFQLRFRCGLQAGAALCLTTGIAAPAIAGEFDLLGMETPTTQYLIDDAGVLNKTTRKSINNTLTSLEVNATASSFPSPEWS